MSKQKKGMDVVEKIKLLDKYRDGTLSKEEVEKLRTILGKEMRKAEIDGNNDAIVVVGLMLLGLAWLENKGHTEKFEEVNE